MEFKTQPRIELSPPLKITPAITLPTPRSSNHITGGRSSIGLTFWQTGRFKSIQKEPPPPQVQGSQVTCTENGMSVAFKLPLSLDYVINNQNIDGPHLDLDSVVLAAVRMGGQQVLFRLYGRVWRGRKWEFFTW